LWSRFICPFLIGDMRKVDGLHDGAGGKSALFAEHIEIFLYISITIKVYKNRDESLCNLYSKYLKVSIDKKNIW